MTTKEEPKKLYKICTQTNYYEQYEIEANSYEEAVDSVMESINYGTSDYPINVERTCYEFDHKEVLTGSSDHVGLFAVESTDPDNDYLISTESIGNWRDCTSEEWVKDRDEAVAAGYTYSS